MQKYTSPVTQPILEQLSDVESHDMPVERRNAEGVRNFDREFNEVKNDLGKINVGDSVVGFDNLDEFDALASALPHARLTLPKLLSEQSSTYYARVRTPRLSPAGKKLYPGWRSGWQLPSQQLIPKKVNGQTFNGKVTDMKVTLLAENITRRETGYPDHHAGNQVVIGLSGNLHSTGRPMIAAPSKLLIMTSSDRGILPTLQYVNVGDDVDAAFERLSAESHEVARKLTVDGLRKAFSAGLPGKGKRR